MKNYIKYILIAIALVAILVLAVFAYNYLSSRYRPQDAEKTATEAFSVSASDTEAIEKAPDFTVADIDGNKVNLSDFYGKPIVINFWATWCTPCKSELPAFDKLYAENKAAVVFLMVNLTDGYRDTVSGVQAFVTEKKYSFPVYFDTQYSAAYAYNVSSIPMTILIDKNGALFDTHIGAMDESALGTYLSDLLSER